MRIASLKSFRILMFAGVAAVALSACANNRTSMAQADFGGASATQQATALSQLAGRYKANPRDKATIIYYAAALRAAPAGAPSAAICGASAPRTRVTSTGAASRSGSSRRMAPRSTSGSVPL